MNVKPEISVVVIGLNEEKLVGKCMQSLANQDFHYPYEVIFVDGGSTDKTLEIVSSYVKKLPLTMCGHTIHTIGDARETGFRMTKADIIASTDADIILPPDWIQTIYDHIEKNSECVGLVGSYTIYTHGALVQSIFLALCRIIDICANKVSGFQAFRGMNFAIRRSIWQKAGGFQRNVSAMEDADLARKSSHFGKICYLPKLTVSTTARRFKKNFILGMIYRALAYYYRIYLQDHTKFTTWEQIRE